jgi:hypothetical protein
MRLQISVFLFVIPTLLMAQSDVCQNAYMPFANGTEFELTSYNQKGKVTSVAQHHIKQVTAHGAAFRAMVEMRLIDDQGKFIRDATNYIDCNEDGLLVHMSSMLAPESMSAMSAMVVALTGDGLKIPKHLSAGQSLPDGQMEVKASINGLQIMKLVLDISDRQVISSEEVSVPAGTFDCIKLKQTTTISGIGNRSYTGTTWLAPGIGTVRSENYDKKGELDSYTELTKFSSGR